MEAKMEFLLLGIQLNLAFMVMLQAAILFFVVKIFLSVGREWRK